MPPDRPSSAREKAAAPGVVARAERQRAQRRALVGRVVGNFDWREVARPRVEVDEHDGALVLGAARDDLAAASSARAGAVEDQIVLPAHLIDEHQRPRPAPRRGGQHARAQVALLHGVGRGRDVDDDLGAGGDQRLDRIGAVEALRPEIGVVPDVLADRDAEAPAAEGHGGAPRSPARSSATRRRRRRWAGATCASRTRRGRPR